MDYGGDEAYDQSEPIRFRWWEWVALVLFLLAVCTFYSPLFR